jgi:hypothetical protein
MLLTGIDINSVLTLKPKYHQYDNLLSCLSIVFNVDISRKIEINLRQSELDLIIGWSSLLERTFKGFKQTIDYDEFEAKINYNLEGDSNSSELLDWDDNQSYSTISILKEFELVDPVKESDLKEYTSDNCLESDRQFSFSSDEVSSTSSTPIGKVKEKSKDFSQNRRFKNTPVQLKGKSMFIKTEMFNYF